MIYEINENTKGNLYNTTNTMSQVAMCGISESGGIEQQHFLCVCSINQHLERANTSRVLDSIVLLWRWMTIGRENLIVQGRTIRDQHFLPPCAFAALSLPCLRQLRILGSRNSRAATTRMLQKHMLSIPLSSKNLRKFTCLGDFICPSSLELIYGGSPSHPCTNSMVVSQEQ